MLDIAVLDKAAYWVNVAYIASVFLTLVLSVLVVFLSNRRSALKSQELESLQAAAAERLAVATQRAAEADQRAAAAAAAASKAQSDAAASLREQEQLRKANLQLSMDLETEKRLRLELENQAAGSVDGQQRIMTAEQVKLLSSAMTPFAGKSATIIQLADPEAGTLAAQIRSVLENSQWNVFVTQVGALTPPQQGIICTHAPADAAASALVSTLRSFKLIVYERTENVDRFQIIVGLRPRT
jgi:hypothetical protein